jgi:cobalt-zinc-cadmium resistance protein CzcA
MIRKIVSFAIHQPLFLILLLVLFIGAGVAAFHALPIEAFPDVTDVQVSVITLFPGHAPEEVEKQVTIPLEIELSGLPHSARQQVQERLQNADLPDGVKPSLGALASPVARSSAST